MENFVVLPEYVEMRKDLIALDPDPKLQREFYPALLKSAGEKLDVKDFIKLMGKAIKRYFGDVNLNSHTGDELFLTVDKTIDLFVKKEETKSVIKSEVRLIDLS